MSKRSTVTWPLICAAAMASAAAALPALPGCSGGGDVPVEDALDLVDGPEGEMDVPEDDGADEPVEIVEGEESQAVECSTTGTVPEWVEADCAASRVTARCGLVDLQVTAYEDGLLRLRYAAHGDTHVDRSWSVTALPPPDASFSVTPGAEGIEMATDDFSITLYPVSCRIRVADSAGTLLLEDPADGAWREGTETVDGASVRTQSVGRLTPTGEHFYGFGEKTGPLDKRGRRMIFWNSDPYDIIYGGYGPDADPLYQSVPFFVGLRGATAYGVLTDNTYRTEMDMAAADTEGYAVKVFGGLIDQYLVAGPSMGEVLRRYTGLTGRPLLPPLWSLGYHQSRWGYSPDSRFEEIGRQFRERRIPADGLWLDIQHMNGFRTFTWDPVAFPDPEGMMSRLSSQGFKTIVIADPGLKVDAEWDVYLGGLAGDYYLKTPDGEPYEGSVWPGPAVFPDFTDPAARAWWGSQVQTLIDTGVQGIWLDVNEPSNFTMDAGGTIPNDVIARGDGVATTMAEVHNVYALSEARATYEGMRQAAPEHRPFILSRAGFAGMQRYAALWTGDAPSSWASLGQTLPMLLNMGLSGLPFVGSDVGGFSGHATPELFARWMAVGSISPFFRGHVTSGVNNQEPWEFGLEVEDISRDFITERYSLLPYLYSLVAESAASGAPVLRPMVYVFQDDPSMHDIGDQAMLGPFLLFAPVTDEGAARRTISLPAGRWYEAHSGAVFDGPAALDMEITLAALPVYVREGAIVPTCQPRMWTGEAGIDPLYLGIYPAPYPTTFTLYEDGGDGFGYDGLSEYSRVTYTLERSGTGARLAAAPREGAYVPASRTLVVRLHRADSGALSVTFNGSGLDALGTYEELIAAGFGWWYDPRDLSIVVALPDQDDFELTFDYDTALSDPNPDVLVSFEVTLPPGTPTDMPISIATSASAWSQVPLEWGPEPDTARGLVPLPRGEWFYYKYTRGDWATVEKWEGCLEAANRYGLAAAYPVRHDVVATWADWCP